MTDHSDGMMTGAFISGLRPGRLFKDLIARPPLSLEDLYNQANNFIRVEEQTTKIGFVRQNVDLRITDPIQPIRISTKNQGTRQSLWLLGVITLPLTMYDYRGVGMKKLGAIASTLHALIKFPIQSGIDTVRGDIPSTQTCFQISRKREHDPKTSSTLTQEGNKKEKGVIVNDEHLDQQVIIGAELPTRLKDQLRHMLRANNDIFAWSPADITGIPRHLAEHKLNIHPRTFPVKQNKRVLAKDRNIAVSEEVKKLVDARILKEAFFSRWTSNPLGRNIEIYVDDMVIKSRNEGSLMLDIEEIFFTLRRINMKLNPKKCIFGVETSQFLGHMITSEGIEANPHKVKAIIDMVSPQTITEVQSLNGKLAAFGRFLARSAERSLPFFKTLKGCMNKKDFRWSKEADEAFQELKAHLKSLLALTIPTPEEELILYLAATREAISYVLMTERDHIQKPIYFVSKALQGPEINHPTLEKLALALVHTARRLRRYFQSHTICVLTHQPIRQVPLKPENSRRLAKWAIELDEHDITYKPRTTVKGQILADIGAESTIKDGALSNDGSGAGLILTDPRGNEVTYALIFDFPTSNNEAEYEALIVGLELATCLEVSHLKVFSDSLLITNHVKGIYEAREDSMKRNIAKTQRLLENFKSFSITQIPHSKNKRADALSRVKFLVVAVDYFTKWVEAEPLATVTGKNILKFVWKNIMCHFGIPGIIISDNGKQFAKNPFRLKTRLGNAKGLWMEELPKFLWAYQTTAHTGNNCTPFSLVYGSKAVLPPKIGLPTFRIHSFENTPNNDELRLNLDLLKERRELAALCEAKYKSQTKQYYNKNLRHTHLKFGDFVLRNSEAVDKEASEI
ncbi:reverse transcriptase domain-containing protein [Tanacetum coccineum]